jgi:hypothetical protein
MELNTGKTVKWHEAVSPYHHSAGSHSQGLSQERDKKKRTKKPFSRNKK